METAENTTCQKKCCANGAHRVVKKVAYITLVIAALVWLDSNFNILSSSQATKQARAQLQAVFLTNGQIYFGVLSRYGVGYWQLDRAHYLQVSKTPAADPPNEKDIAAPQETRTTLMKISDDMHRPKDTMIIPASNILFWQNLQNTSSVAQAIASDR